MTSASLQNARMWRMRTAETRALADEMKELEPKAIRSTRDPSSEHLTDIAKLPEVVRRPSN